MVWPVRPCASVEPHAGKPVFGFTTFPTSGKARISIMAQQERDGTGQGSRPATHQVPLLDLDQFCGAVWTHRLSRWVGAGGQASPTAKETSENQVNAEAEVGGPICDADYPHRRITQQTIVDEKIPVLTRDVNIAWKTLYDRQAPLLTWPEPVQERFRKWGRKWPETEDAGKVTLAQVDYIMAYKDYVDMVYKTFKPFDFESGEGIVVAPPKDALLRPSEFSEEHVPGLSAIWSAQERLWIQRTLLEVVAQVNKNANAKDWSSAIIRQIEGIEVGSPVAQDQRLGRQ